ncbi:unnamed protein product, partial [Cladocopium goreaui]
DHLQVASAEEESEKDTRLWAGQDPNCSQRRPPALNLNSDDKMSGRAVSAMPDCGVAVPKGGSSEPRWKSLEEEMQKRREPLLEEEEDNRDLDSEAQYISSEEEVRVSVDNPLLRRFATLPWGVETCIQSNHPADQADDHKTADAWVSLPCADFTPWQHMNVHRQMLRLISYVHSTADRMIQVTQRSYDTVVAYIALMLRPLTSFAPFIQPDFFWQAHYEEMADGEELLALEEKPPLQEVRPFFVWQEVHLSTGTYSRWADDEEMAQAQAFLYKFYNTRHHPFLLCRGLDGIVKQGNSAERPVCCVRVLRGRVDKPPQPMRPSRCPMFDDDSESEALSRARAVYEEMERARYQPVKDSRHLQPAVQLLFVSQLARQLAKQLDCERGCCQPPVFEASVPLSDFQLEKLPVPEKL